MIDVLELTDETSDVGAILDKFARMFGTLSPEDQAYMVVRGFFGVADPNDEMYDEFHRWLSDNNNREAKQSAMERIMREYLENQETATL